jgi:hypothetical protein
MENIFPTIQANFGPRAIAHQTTGRTRLLGQQALVVHGQPNWPDLAKGGGGVVTVAARGGGSPESCSQLLRRTTSSRRGQPAMSGGRVGLVADSTSAEKWTRSLFA